MMFVTELRVGGAIFIFSALRIGGFTVSLISIFIHPLNVLATRNFKANSVSYSWVLVSEFSLIQANV